MSKHIFELISLWVAPFAHGHGAGDSAVRRVPAWAPIEHGRKPVVLSVKINTNPAVPAPRIHWRRPFTGCIQRPLLPLTARRPRGYDPPSQHIRVTNVAIPAVRACCVGTRCRARCDCDAGCADRVVFWY